MKISIITVCFNAGQTLGDTLDSVAIQTFQNIEHIVVDGGSVDGTLDILKSITAPFFNWISEPDQGIYDAMNKGIAMATGEVIGTLNADDFYYDNTVLSQVAEVFADPSIEACYADLIYVDQLDSNKVVRYWRSCDFKQGLFEKGWMPAHPTFFVRRSVYEKLGVFDLDYRRQADFELTMRFLAINCITSIYLPKIWVKMRMGGVSNNSVLGVIKGNLEAYHACRKNGLNVWMLTFIFRKVLSRIPQFFLRPLP